MNDPALVFEVVGHFEHAGVMVDADDLLEERRRASGERALQLNADARNFRRFSPDETSSNRLERCVRGHGLLFDGGGYSHR